MIMCSEEVCVRILRFSGSAYGTISVAVVIDSARTTHRVMLHRCLEISCVSAEDTRVPESRPLAVNV